MHLKPIAMAQGRDEQNICSNTIVVLMCIHQHSIITHKVIESPVNKLNHNDRCPLFALMSYTLTTVALMKGTPSND